MYKTSLNFFTTCVLVTNLECNQKIRSSNRLMLKDCFGTLKGHRWVHFNDISMYFT